MSPVVTSGGRDCEQYRHLIEMYDWPVETAMEICRLESQGVATADNWNDSHRGCDGSFGLFQIGCLHGHDRERLHIPEVNVKVAYDLWRSEGFYPWTTYKKIALR